jgi:polysaccharide pyruvyl transferase WcaK-like protein
VHAYVGRTTAGWIEQLKLRDDESVYRAADRRRWLSRLVLGPGPRVLVFDPGEVPLGTAHLKSEVTFLAVVLAVRLRGGVVFRPPRAVGDFHPLVAAIYRASARLSQITLWRDDESLRRMRVGRLVPDTAFAEPYSAEPDAHRDALIVSMRGKRPLPPAAWFDSISMYAAESGLSILAVSQVDEDEDRSRELAENFPAGSATYLAWGERSDLEQELRVRELYQRAAIVVSDRLHVLILASQAGAVPVELAPTPKPKVRTHFATIGMHDVSLDLSTSSAAEALGFLRGVATRREELTERMTLARSLLGKEIAHFHGLVGRKSGA